MQWMISCTKNCRSQSLQRCHQPMPKLKMLPVSMVLLLSSFLSLSALILLVGITTVWLDGVGLVIVRLLVQLLAGALPSCSHAVCFCSPSSIIWNVNSRTVVTLCGWEGNHRSGVALAMCHGLSGLSTYGLNGHRKGVSTLPMPLVGYGVYLSLQLQVFSPIVTRFFIGGPSVVPLCQRDE